MQNMIKEGVEKEQVELMRSCLIHEVTYQKNISYIYVTHIKKIYLTYMLQGWEDDVHLPAQWKVRKSEGSTNGQFDVNYYYLSSDGTMFHSTRAVIN